MKGKLTQHQIIEDDITIAEREVEERAKAITKICSDLKDVDKIMQDLSALTQQQGRILGILILLN